MKAFLAIMFVLFVTAALAAGMLFKENAQLKQRIVDLQADVIANATNGTARVAELESMLGKANAEIEHMKNTLPAHTPAK